MIHEQTLLTRIHLKSSTLNLKTIFFLKLLICSGITKKSVLIMKYNKIHLFIYNINCIMLF